MMIRDRFEGVTGFGEATAIGGEVVWIAPPHTLEALLQAPT